MREPDCKYCKTGVEMERLWKAKQKKEAMKYGQKCAMCIHNRIKGVKAKAYARIYPGFQTCDNFEDVEL